VTATGLLKSLVPKFLKSYLKLLMGFKTMESRLQNLRRAGFECTGAIDVGAYHGEWSQGLRSVWDTPLIMVEPQPSCTPFLKDFASRVGGAPIHLEPCALGKEAGSVEFLLEETNSRMAPSGHATSGPVIQVPVKTLREVIPRYLEKFNLLKADVQGFELDVLEGAGDLLQQFEVIILEVSVIRIGPVPTFYEVMQYMNAKGYRLYDFLPMYYRPLDNALWQGDAFFVRNDSKLVSSLSWD
jgi:FkbM family methyltransferase